MINGVEKTLDVMPEVGNSRTYIPFRFLAEAFGSNVNWDGTNFVVDVNN
jgi:hypothetical protein